LPAVVVRPKLLALLACLVALLGALVLAPATSARADTVWNTEVSSTAYLGAPAPCTDLLYVAVRGAGENRGDGRTLDALTDTVQGGLDRRDADATVTPVFIDFASTDVATLLDETTGATALPADYTQAVATGVTRLTAVLSHARTDCPSQKWVLAGYSQGGQVIDQVLQSSTDLDRIVGVALIGDAGNYAGKPQTLVGDDANASGQGLADALASRVTTPEALASVTWSLCSAGDVVCDSTPSADAHALAAGLETHQSYRSDPRLGRWFAPLTAHLASLYPSLS
jgi:hypothetical protein